MNNKQSVSPLPIFSQIQAEEIEPALDSVLAENRALIASILKQVHYTWENLVLPLEEMSDRLHNMWSPVNHLNAVVNSPALRQVYQTCLPKLTEYATELGQNEALYQAFKQLAERADFQTLNSQQQRVIEHELRDFKLAGVALNPEAKQAYRELRNELAKLCNQFEDNVLDAVNHWEYLITDAKQITGIPKHALQAASDAAIAKGQQGWLFNLEYPSFHAIITYADDAALRERFYTAYVTRASDQGPNAGGWDNSQVMAGILKCRYEIAQLLGFKNYAEYAMATKMAKTPEKVLNFLQDLAARTRPIAQQEWQALQAFAKAQFEILNLSAWDIAYYSEKMYQANYHFSQEDLRPYFSTDQVLLGKFALVKRLYNIDIQEVTAGVDVWHEQVRYFAVYDQSNNLCGGFYLDLYARAHKRGGAWMDECHIRRRRQDGSLQLPIAYLTCNFSGPSNDSPALLTHDEVLTLFHEFGHGLQHLLTQMEYASISGINGIEWDAVELPSQFMENWAWQPEVLTTFARHYQTAEILPAQLIEKMLAAKNFQTGLQMVRQMEFSLFDFKMHLEKAANIQVLLDEVRDTIGVIKAPAFNRFQHSFSHIFAGGYAAAYYSYKWAEVLSADAFARFEEEGLFNPEVGKAFLKCFLEPGGSRDSMDSFIAFRGREPEIDALLHHSGIAL
jgi:oligopeptidase A